MPSISLGEKKGISPFQYSLIEVLGVPPLPIFIRLPKRIESPLEDSTTLENKALI